MDARMKRFMRTGMPRGRRMPHKTLMKLGMTQEEMTGLVQDYSQIQGASKAIREANNWSEERAIPWSQVEQVVASENGGAGGAGIKGWKKMRNVGRFGNSLAKLAAESSEDAGSASAKPLKSANTNE